MKLLNEEDIKNKLYLKSFMEYVNIGLDFNDEILDYIMHYPQMNNHNRIEIITEFGNYNYDELISVIKKYKIKIENAEQITKLLDMYNNSENMVKLLKYLIKHQPDIFNKNNLKRLFDDLLIIISNNETNLEICSKLIHLLYSLPAMMKNNPYVQL